jgi:protein-S-isoprenylcysteine O-methyltransferase Ste14
MSVLWAWVSLVVSVALPPILFLSFAGRWDLWYGWAYAGILAIVFSFNLLSLYFKNPDLLKERMKPPSGLAYWTGPIIPAVALLLQPSIAGLDNRLHWSDIVPVPGVWAGLVTVAIGWALVNWAELINPFFSGAIRIQADRGQRVITKGPYAIVRHPGYAAGILAAFAGALALNSLISIIPVAVIALPILVYRTIIEDQMLHEELPGYSDYAARVRYRLIPGIW